MPCVATVPCGPGLSICRRLSSKTASAVLVKGDSETDRQTYKDRGHKAPTKTYNGVCVCLYVFVAGSFFLGLKAVCVSL